MRTTHTDRIRGLNSSIATSAGTTAVSHRTATRGAGRTRTDCVAAANLRPCVRWSSSRSKMLTPCIYGETCSETLGQDLQYRLPVPGSRSGTAPRSTAEDYAIRARTVTCHRRRESSGAVSLREFDDVLTGQEPGKWRGRNQVQETSTVFSKAFIAECLIALDRVRARPLRPRPVKPVRIPMPSSAATVRRKRSGRSPWRKAAIFHTSPFQCPPVGDLMRIVPSTD